jgi:hypothetical protein
MHLPGLQRGSCHPAKDQPAPPPSLPGKEIYRASMTGVVSGLVSAIERFTSGLVQLLGQV